MKNKAKKGTIWVCGACGKTSKTRMPTEDLLSLGWDEACMLHAVLCQEDSLQFDEHGRVTYALPVKMELSDNG